MTDSALAIRLENFGTAFCETDREWNRTLFSRAQPSCGALRLYWHKFRHSDSGESINFASGT